MERLTIRNSDGSISQPTHSTGLRPEDIPSAVELAEIACALETLKKYQAIGAADRLRELAIADREGRVRVMPCPVGTKVWCKVHSKEDAPDWLAWGVLSEFFCYETEQYYVFKYLNERGEEAKVDVPANGIGDVWFLPRKDTETA